MGENRNKETDWKLSKQAKTEPRLLRQKKKMDSKTTGKKRWHDRKKMRGLRGRRRGKAFYLKIDLALHRRKDYNI